MPPLPESFPQYTNNTINTAGMFSGNAIGRVGSTITATTNAHMQIVTDDDQTVKYPSSNRRVSSGKPTRTRRRRPQKPGKTANNNERRFVAHNYHDHANDVDETPGKRRRTNLFPIKLHKVLDEEELQSIASWQPHGRCFIIHKTKQFVAEVLPSFFRQTKLTSFQRQLSLYGFQRITTGPDAGGYYHELFLRGMPFLCYKMDRAVVKGTRIKAASNPDQEPNFYTMSSVKPYHESSTNVAVNNSTVPATPGAVSAFADSSPEAASPNNNSYENVQLTAAQAQSYLLEQQRQQVLSAMTPLERLFAEAPAVLQPPAASTQPVLPGGDLLEQQQQPAEAFPNNENCNTNINNAGVQQQRNLQPPPQAQPMLPVMSKGSDNAICHNDIPFRQLHPVPAYVEIVNQQTLPMPGSPQGQQQQQQQVYGQVKPQAQIEPLPLVQHNYQAVRVNIPRTQQYNGQQNRRCNSGVVSDDSRSGSGEDVFDLLVDGLADNNNNSNQNANYNNNRKPQQSDKGFVKTLLDDDEPLQRMLDTLTQMEK